MRLYAAHRRRRAAPAPARKHAPGHARTLHLINPALGASAWLSGPLPAAWDQTQLPDGRWTVQGEFTPQADVLVYQLSLRPLGAAATPGHLSAAHALGLLRATLEAWRVRWSSTPEDLLLRRGLLYGWQMAIPVGETRCLLTDHMLLPLSWNRDAYYVARLLLDWPSGGGPEIVRRHLLWLFEQAERPDGAWGRAYLANGQVKDRGYQLDQQIFPLLELADYALATDDHATLERLRPHIAPTLQGILARGQGWLLPTEETPADDPIAYPYHFSSHVLLWYTLTRLAALPLAGDYPAQAAALHAAIWRAFALEHQGRRLFAYAIDGTGQAHFYHDANDLPLALAPQWGFCPATDPTWQATLAFAFSESNQGGSYAGGLGSVHTRAPWPLGDVQGLLMASAQGDPARYAAFLERLHRAAQWDGALPEAYAPGDFRVVSRHWFAWPNAAYGLGIASKPAQPPKEDP
ncbi:MAG: glycoside hydrolase family 125 protein [Anaerolineae bacterium]|nr:glycoside hydrolase family 125 protein [Anaerolineae bacterium]